MKGWKMEIAGTSAWNCRDCDAIFVAPEPVLVREIKCPHCGGSAKAIRVNPSKVQALGQDIGCVLLLDAQQS